jgi:CRP-like cAMP-binding protein
MMESATLIDLGYDDFVAKALQMPPEVLDDLAEALEDRIRGLEAAVVASRVKGDKGAEVRLLMALAWNARKLAAVKALLAEAKWRDERGGES